MRVRSIDELINHVINKINNDWNNLEKIRFVYIEVGKYICKNTDFFEALNSKQKFEILDYDENKLFDIYNDNKSITNDDWNKVICKSAAHILKMIFDKINIKSELISTINSVETQVNQTDEQDDISLKINHWFLAVNDGTNTYFLTLVADLPNIQNGFKTKHFATNIPYKRKGKDGKEHITYSGQQINNKVLTNEELEQIDKKIGYLNTIYNDDYVYTDLFFDILEEKNLGNKYYYTLEEEQTEFYNEIVKFISGNFKSLDDFNNENTNNLIELICNKVQKRICKILNINNNTESFINLQEWENRIKKIIENHYDNNKLYIQNPKELFGISKALNKYLIQFSLAKKKKEFRPRFYQLLQRISYYFLDENKLYQTNQNGYVPNSFIENKFFTVFKNIFNINEQIEPFNTLEYSEQIVIIKNALRIIFKDLKKEECNAEFINYNDLYSPIFNRINMYPIKSKKDKTYNVIFHIKKGATNEIESYYLYELKNNKLRKLDRLDIFILKQEYFILSERLNCQLNNIENIEDIETKKTK